MVIVLAASLVACSDGGMTAPVPVESASRPAAMVADGDGGGGGGGWLIRDDLVYTQLVNRFALAGLEAHLGTNASLASSDSLLARLDGGRLAFYIEVPAPGAPVMMAPPASPAMLADHYGIYSLMDDVADMVNQSRGGGGYQGPENPITCGDIRAALPEASARVRDLERAQREYRQNATEDFSWGLISSGIAGWYSSRVTGAPAPTVGAIVGGYVLGVAVQHGPRAASVETNLWHARIIRDFVAGMFRMHNCF
jgi:hypothetical protein